MRNVRALVVGVGAFALLGGFVVGVPVCLVRLIGNPFPASLPTWSSLVDIVVDGALPSGVMERVLAVMVWVWWSQVALSFLAELVAVCRGRPARPLPLRAFGMQSVVVRLVALVVAAAGSFAALANPVIAATPSFADVAIPIGAGGEVHEARNGVFVGPVSRSVHPAGEVAAPVLAPPLQVPPGSLRSAVAELPAPVLSPALQFVADFPPAAAPEVPAPVLAPSPRQPRAVPPTAVDAASEAALSTSPAIDSISTVTVDPVPAVKPVAEPPGESRAAPGAVRVDPVSDPAAGPTNPIVPAPPVMAESGWVVVRPGDSLWHLAAKHLGDAMRWGEIYELNSGPLPGGGTLRDPNLIHPGWRLRLPTVEHSAVSSLAAGELRLESPAAPDSTAAPPMLWPGPHASPS